MHPIVAVCCLTRQRPVMLTALLKSFVALNKPQSVRTLFVVVENDTAPIRKPSWKANWRARISSMRLNP
jgi:hypothetical protein